MSIEHMKEVLQLLIKKSPDLEITLNPPAIEKELKSLEEAIGQELPKDIFDFYSYCNGIETLNYIFRVIPIHEILEYKHELDKSCFYFAEYMIYSDSWIVSLKNREEYVIVNNNHGTDKVVELTSSVFEFIDRYASGGIFGANGLYAWYEKLRLNESII